MSYHLTINELQCDIVTLMAEFNKKLTQKRSEAACFCFKSRHYLFPCRPQQKTKAAPFMWLGGTFDIIPTVGTYCSPAGNVSFPSWEREQKRHFCVPTTPQLDANYAVVTKRPRRNCNATTAILQWWHKGDIKNPPSPLYVFAYQQLKQKGDILLKKQTMPPLLTEQRHCVHRIFNPFNLWSF